MSASPAEIPSTDGAMSPSQLFVINLCASTSPMALAQPNVPALKRYTFFVSRQRDDGRDRFRLHMGYFASQDEAEKLLDAVRDVYPAAWTGPAPANGAPRRGRVAVAAVVAVAATPAPAAVVAAPAIQPLPDVLDAMSNVRDVLASLDESPAPRIEAAGDSEPGLQENEVLRVLEASAKSVAESGKFLTQPRAQVRLVTSQDTQTLADIQSDADNNAPPCFAVQLVWSVSPIDVARLPHLAIFDAYTLYNVEGNREGRKWYGVRLGFFSDSAAASQVANYVRSDYRAVAIVPVALKEREGAGGGVGKKPKAAAPPLNNAPKPVTLPVIGGENIEGFQLLEDDRPAPLKLDFDDKPAAKKVAPTVPVAKPVAGSASKASARSANKVPGKATGKPTGKRVVVRKRPPTRPGAPNPLESTLEILGASTLTMDESRELINDSAVRQPIDRKQGGRFSKLLSRLSGN
ncbi:MAG: hypothetical protein ABI645_10285 [Pseudomonadota bacterium]